MKPYDRVNRIQQEQPTGATVLEVRWDNVLIEYDEGGEGWWPIGCVSIIDNTNWPAFKMAMLGNPDVKTAVLAALPIEPLAALGLANSLDRAIDGDYDDFRGCWLAIRRAVGVPRAVRETILSEAQTANLPQAFLDVLS